MVKFILYSQWSITLAPLMVLPMQLMWTPQLSLLSLIIVHAIQTRKQLYNLLIVRRYYEEK